MTDMLRSAQVSECGRYRYALARRWDAGAREAIFVMLNPSIADGLRDDPTVRKCIGFARRWALGGIRITNLFAMRATDPKELHLCIRRGDDAVGPLNAEYLLAMTMGVSRVVLAWGAHARPYEKHVRSVVELFGPRPLWCLGRTADGHPAHPLMLPYSTLLEPYDHKQRKTA